MNFFDDYPINRERLVDSFLRMVEVGSVSGQEGQFRDLLQAEFGLLGLCGQEDEAGSKLKGNSGNFLVKLPGNVDKPPLLLTAHMDTVVPGNNIKAIIVRDQAGELIKSSGDTILGGDDKAGVAALLEAVKVVLEQDFAHPPLELLFTVSEEQGLLGIKNFDFSAIKASKGYVLDSGGDPGTIIVKSPCQNEIEYKVHGKSAHAGINPEDGHNAIHIMAKALAKMPCGRVDTETTCNFGIIEGGLARNIVPSFCRVKGEARSLQRAKLNLLTDELCETFKAEVIRNGGQPEVDVVLLYPETALNPDDEVVTLAIRAAEKIGIASKLEGTGGGSDASIINGSGIPCANLGIGMQKVHTVDEFITVNDLVADAAWILSIIKEAGL